LAAVISWLVAREHWLPALAALAWWTTFHPGFFGEDSLINLAAARSGAISVWFTAWWVYVVEALTIGRRAIAHPIAVVDHYRGLVGVWLSLGARYPAEMAAAHASRVRLFLPPLVTGPPEIVSFLHSTILPNDFGLAWTFPALAERARAMVRAWNAMGYVLANAAVWLIVLIVAAWRLPEHRAALTPAIVIAVALDLGLIAAAPISEGRYGLFILICGQTTAVFSLMRRLS
jgi:hypothetical protein